MPRAYEIREGGMNDLDRLEATWRFLHAHHGAISVALVPFRTADERWPARLEEFREAIADGGGMVLVGLLAPLDPVTGEGGAGRN